MKKLLIILIIPTILIFITGCTSNSSISNDELKIAEERAVFLTRSSSYTNCTVVDTEYLKETQSFIVYMELDDGRSKMATIDLLSKDENGKFNKVQIEDWVK